jgi:SAM-dependent methyltransferase
MPRTTSTFYDRLAEHYHLIFEDWDRSIEGQAKVLNPLLASEMGQRPLKILDCACGIGTQAIGFAKAGHHVVASDLSRAAIGRAKYEAARHELDIAFYVSDMTRLAEIEDRDFDVVAAMDNALPHMSAMQIELAVRAIRSKLKPDGLFIASIRDYDQIVPQRPLIQGPSFYGDHASRRIVHQVWDWLDESRYVLHLYITTRDAHGWTSHHFVSEYRCVRRSELSRALAANGFKNVRWLMPGESGFYQPVVIGRRG